MCALRHRVMASDDVCLSDRAAGVRVVSQTALLLRKCFTSSRPTKTHTTDAADQGVEDDDGGGNPFSDVFVCKYVRFRARSEERRKAILARLTAAKRRRMATVGHSTRGESAQGNTPHQ